MARAIDITKIRTNHIGSARTVRGIIKSVSLPQVWVKDGIYLCGQKQHRGTRKQENPLSYPGPILPEAEDENAPALHDKTCRLVVEESTLSDYQVIEFEDSNVTMIYENKKPFPYKNGTVIVYSGTVMLSQNPTSKDNTNSISILAQRCKPCDKWPDKEHSKYDESLIRAGTNPKAMVRNQEKVIINIIKRLQQENGSSANLLDLLTEAERNEIQRGRAEDIADKLCRDGRLMRPSGYDTLQCV